jgi:hypothetical protein
LLAIKVKTAQALADAHRILVRGAGSRVTRVVTRIRALLARLATSGSFGVAESVGGGMWENPPDESCSERTCDTNLRGITVPAHKADGKESPGNQHWARLMGD